MQFNGPFVMKERAPMDDLQLAELKFEVKEQMPLTPHACILWKRRLPTALTPSSQVRISSWRHA